MNPPVPRPANEAQRLQRLQELLVLDSAPEPLFDELARMATEICGTPAALLSLVDADRQWFKANVGLSGVTQTPRDQAFCAHAILGEQLMQVPDATRDPRFVANPLVTGAPHIRFYAGAPLTMPDGTSIGTLCALDFQARQLTPAQVQELERLARIAVQALIMRRDLVERALSARSRYEDTLAEREDFLRLITDSLPVRMAYIDRECRYRFVNQAHAARFDLPREQLLGKRQADLRLRHPIDPPVQPYVQAALDGQPQNFEYVEEVEGRLRRIEAQLLPDLDAQQQLRGIFAIGVDITARAETEQLLRRQRATLHSVAELMPAMVAVVGADGLYRFANRAYGQWHGVAPEAMVGRTPRDVLGEERHAEASPWIARAQAGEPVHFERHYPEHGQGQYLAFSYVPLRLEDGTLDGFVVVAQDITDHRREQQRLRGLSQRDALTGLLNRTGLQDWLALRRPDEDAQLGLLCIDLDYFKPVNDQHGHPVGDALLRLFGERLRGLVRPTDAVVRMGGDEFAVLLTGVRNPDALRLVADKIVAAAHAPFQVGTLTLHIGASVGTALGLDPAQGWDALLARADAMLYRAKSEGRGRAMGEAAAGQRGP